TITLGPFVDSTDGATAETALTLSQADVRLSKNGGAFAQKNDANNCTHQENGNYACPLSTTDTNALGLLRVAVNKSGALPVWRDFTVLPANVYDSLVLGSDRLDVDAAQVTANAITSSALDASAAAELADAVWDEARAGHTSAGTFGLYLDAQVSAAASPPSAATIADAVWDEALSSHLATGSAGDQLNNAGGAAADPWAAALPGTYPANTAGWIIGQRLDARVSAMSGNSPGAGAAEFTYTLTEASAGDPIADADVWVTTDSAGAVVVASGRTDQNGRVTFYLDPGTVYLWRQKSGWNFANPDAETVG
ncbi:MAG TPA: hypothetical protein PLH39_01665, partial [Promineifilum sp.]|nr:hypothetical protein [Promineifilum sp.]